MAIYTIGTPDGRKLRIEAADEATAIRGAQEWTADNPPAEQQSVPASGPATPPAGLKPGTREYADWAAQAARAGQQLPQVSNPAMTETQSSILDPFVQGVTFGWGDEMRGAVQGGLAAAQGGDFGSVYDQTVDESRGALQHERAANPVGSFAAEVTGAIPTGMGLGGQLVGRGASLGARALTGLGVGAAQGATYGAGASDEGNRLTGAMVGGATGGIVGAAAPYVGNTIANRIQGAAQRQATNAAIKGAPAANDLKAAASAMFQQVDSSGVAVDPNFFATQVQQMANNATKGLIDRELDAPVWRVYQIMADRVKAASDAGRGLTLGEIHNLRQIAQDVAVGAGKGRTARFANEIVDHLDSMMGNLKPGQLVGGQGADKGRVLMEGISTWSRARKAGLIEEAMYRAQNQASGLENGLRTQFRQILQNPKTRRLFSQAEIEAIQEVVQGTTAANVAKLIGKFGFGSGNASNMLGGTIGFGAGSMSPLGPIGGMLAAGGATLARRGSEALTNKAANRAAQVVATPNIPVLPRPNTAIPSLPETAIRSLGIPLNQQASQPLRIVVDGANPIR